jgi:hypothetical protein
MLSGNASQITPISATLPQSALGTGFHAAGKRARVAKPATMRRKVTPLGPTASNPSAMKRKEAPHIKPGRMSTSRSALPLLASAARFSSMVEMVIALSTPCRMVTRTKLGIPRLSCHRKNVFKLEFHRMALRIARNRTSEKIHLPYFE